MAGIALIVAAVAWGIGFFSGRLAGRAWERERVVTLLYVAQSRFKKKSKTDSLLEVIEDNVSQGRDAKAFAARIQDIRTRDSLEVTEEEAHAFSEEK